MFLDFTYYMTFGPGDSSETLDWDIKIDSEDEELIFKIMSEGTPLEESDEIQHLIDEAYDGIYEQEQETYCEIYEDDEEECARFDDYCLEVNVCEPRLDEDGLNRVLDLIFKAHPDDAEEFVDAFGFNHEWDFGKLDNEEEFIFSAAVRNGNSAYVLKHIGDVELNSQAGCCPYLDDTDDEATIQVLLDNGAKHNME